MLFSIRNMDHEIVYYFALPFAKKMITTNPVIMGPDNKLNIIGVYILPKMTINSQHIS